MASEKSHDSAAPEAEALTGSDCFGCRPQTKNRHNIFVLPPPELEFSEKLKIFILPDGNNRALGLNRNYDAGGTKVVEIAHSLAERGDISLMVACIMSRENTQKRSDSFFHKVYQAFLALGIKIVTSGTLVKSGIRMETSGNLDELKAKSEQASNLAYMIEAVCAKTAHIENPRLRLILGINYGPEIALQYDVDLIYRSGMEQQGMVRTSGVRTTPDMSIIGSATLWPNVTPQEICDVIERERRERGKKTFHGYFPQFIRDLITIAIREALPPDAGVIIPYNHADSPHKLIIDQLLREHSSQLPDTKIKFHQTDGTLTTYNDAAGTNRSIILVPAEQSSPETTGDISAAIAPGQSENAIILPENPQIGYATVLSCKPDPESICAAIAKAVKYCLENERLEGAERISLVKEPTTQDAISTSYMRGYEALSAYLKQNRTIEESAESMVGNKFNPENPYHYNLIADLFITKMLEWAGPLEFPLHGKIEFTAFTNYVMTSLFLAYFPSHPKWEQFKNDWEKLAEKLAKYMGLIYACDEAIYDKEYENPDERKSKLGTATEAITRAVRRQPYETPDTPLFVKNIAAELGRLSSDFHAHSHPILFKKWEDALCHLFQSFCAEWDESTFNNPIIENLNDEDSEKRNHARTAFGNKYLEHAPQWIKTRMNATLNGIESCTAKKRTEHIYDLRLFSYLFDIENSIGAGLTFRTIALTIPAERVDDEMIPALDELCTLYNMYFRLANDLSGFICRSLEDAETKTDACTIMTDKHKETGKGDANAIICGTAEIKTLIDELKKEINAKRTKFAKTWPSVGIPIIRSDIAELIYAKGHYRTTTRDQMRDYFCKLAKSGIV